MQVTSLRSALAACAAAVLVACADGRTLAKTGVLSVPAGATQVVEAITTLSQLNVGPGASLVAPEGSSLTLTVNGVSSPITPGSFHGTVVLTPTQDVVERFADMGVDESYRYRSALFVDNGARVPAKSVAAAVVGGVVTDRAASDVAITSREDKFNGIFVTGDSTYTITNAKINLSGNGGNDFMGFGAAIKTGGKSRVTIDRASIVTSGVVRTAIFVGGDSDVTVNDSNIEVHNGILPADYQGGPITGRGGVMMEPPWVLGIIGNVRATNVVSNGTVHYNNSHIKAQGWGALSTDATHDVKLFATHSVIETVESGYGAYADGTSLDTFSDCTFNVADYGLIMTGGSGVFTDGSVVNSRRFGVMMHSGGAGTLSIDKGSVFNTKEAVIQVKSSFPHISVNNAKLNSANGLIIEAIVNDDPHAGAGPGGPGGPGGSGGPGGPGGPGAAGAASSGPLSISASFSNVELNGDILNAMSTLAGMKISLDSGSITGAISTSTAVPAEGKPTARTFGLIGKMTHTLSPTAAAQGMELVLGSHAAWVVSRTSYLTGLTIAPDARVSAPIGRKVALTVDGKPVPLQAGKYAGALVLVVSAG